MKKKEVLTIFVLAVLATGGSWFYERPPGVYISGPIRNIRGFPLPFSGYACTFISCSTFFSFKGFVLDLLFWFLVIFGVWQVVKWIRKGWKK